jgi:predicted nucleotide-binding protein
MDDLLDDLVRMIRTCERSAKSFDEESVKTMVEALQEATNSLRPSSTGSWLGYYSRYYIEGFRPRRQDEFFDPEWGFVGSDYVNRTCGQWVEYEYEEVKEEILRRAHVSTLTPLFDVAERAKNTFTTCKREFEASIEAILSDHSDQALQDRLKKLQGLTSHITAQEFVSVFRPKGQMMVRDMAAANQGIIPPHHILFEAWLFEKTSSSRALLDLADLGNSTVHYLRQRLKMKGKTVAKLNGKVFLGHGRAKDWLELKLFVQDRLHLPVVDFNSQSIAGKPTASRLSEMLDETSFAFLVMTAEDEASDGTQHARENVIHEVGLFQGRLGFERAIVLLEEGCEEFSNIAGLGQIRFQKGKIADKFEEIRAVLEREDIIRP